MAAMTRNIDELATLDVYVEDAYGEFDDTLEATPFPVSYDGEMIILHIDDVNLTIAVEDIENLIYKGAELFLAYP